MGSKSSNNSAPPPEPPLSAAGQAYLTNYPDVAADGGFNPWEHYNLLGKAEGRQWGETILSDQPQQPAPTLLTQLQEFASGIGGASHEAASGLEAISSMREADRLTAGLNRRDSMYSDYLSAAETSVDFINEQIIQEQANADLLGIQYEVTDEQKAERISKYFSSVWGEGDQSTLEGLFGEFGDPEGFEGFSIERYQGDDEGGTVAQDTLIGTSNPSARPNNQRLRAPGFTPPNTRSLLGATTNQIDPRSLITGGI